MSSPSPSPLPPWSRAAVLCAALAACEAPPAGEPPVLPDASLSLGRRVDGGTSGALLGATAALFAQAYHLDTVLGRPAEAEPLYRRVVERGAAAERETALAQVRLAALCRARGDRRGAMKALDWIVSHARLHPALARTAEREIVDMLHPQAGRVSALTRGPPVSFTRLQQVPETLAGAFRDAEQQILRYVRAPLSPQLHNVDGVVAAKRGLLLTAVRAYEPLAASQFPNAVAAALFRQGSLHQDYAEALGRMRLPEELLPRVATHLRVRFHSESVTHFRAALEHYRRAAAVTDVTAERWRQAAALAEAQLGRFTRRRSPLGPR